MTDNNDDYDLFELEFDLGDDWDEAESLNSEGQRSFRNTNRNKKTYVILYSNTSNPISIRLQEKDGHDQTEAFDDIDEGVEQAQDFLDNTDDYTDD